MGLNYVINHTGMWLNIWVFLAILAFLIVIVYFVVKRRKLIKTEEELEELLAQKYEREAAEDSLVSSEDTADEDEAQY